MTRLQTRFAAALALILIPGSCLAPAAERATTKPNRPVASGVAAPLAGSVPPSKARPGAVVAPPAALRDFLLSPEPRQGGIVRGRAPDGTAALTLDGLAVPLTADGRFLLGFDRDAATGGRLVARLANGRMIERFLAVAAGEWRIEHVNTPFRGGAANDAEFARRRPAEIAQINAARHVGAASDGWQQHFIWPVKGRTSGFFGAQRVYQGKPGSYHSGMDIAASTGTVFVAPADGVVVLAAAKAPFTLEGHLLMVDHGMGLTSAFLHCSRLDVKLGDHVVQGQPLGAVGATGRASGPHLHWGMKWRSARVDPQKVVAAAAR